MTDRRNGRTTAGTTGNAVRRGDRRAVRSSGRLRRCFALAAIATVEVDPIPHLTGRQEVGRGIVAAGTAGNPPAIGEGNSGVIWP